VSSAWFVGYINDASYLNRTAVYGIVKVTTVQDIQNALQFARDHNESDRCGSRPHGGHTFVKDGVVSTCAIPSGAAGQRAQNLNVQNGAPGNSLQLYSTNTAGSQAMHHNILRWAGR